MYNPPRLSAEMARSRQAEALAHAERHRLVREGRAPHRPGRPRRAVAGSLLALARRLDPSLRVAASPPVAHTG
jgi:hypothetical protein